MVTIRQRVAKYENLPKTFDTLISRATPADVSKRSQESAKWYQAQAKKMKITGTHLMREDPDRLKNKLAIGEMGFFFYDPKHKKTLPYYDSFPLIFKIETYDDGFLGINLHYLPYALRAKLMDALFSLASNKKYDQTTKLKISYDILKSAAKFAPFKPCVKRYLNAHVRSRFLKINANEYDIALFLPVQSFQKMTATKVWAESRGKV